jgi:lysophospholipid acyltransferase (LPLAT)-like uncharacterized protein
MSTAGAKSAQRPRDEPRDAKPLGFGMRLTISVAAFVIRTLSRSWRVTSVGRESFEGERARGHPVLFSFWHGQMLSLIAEHKLPSSVLISDHRDGEIVARIIEKFGLSVIRGSTSRGASRALLQMSRALSDGTDVGITPDGPRGPRHAYASGALVIAQRTGAPIVPIATVASSSWILNTWDGFEIPKPFARVIVVYDTPIFVTSENARTAAADTARLAEAMDRVAERASATLRRPGEV